MDAQLFAFSLRNVLRAADLAKRVSSSAPILAAIDRFNAAIPDAIAVRDQLAHFDAYELGVGRLQTTRKLKRLAGARSTRGILVHVAPYTFSTASTGTNITIHLGDYRLDVVAAARAAN